MPLNYNKKTRVYRQDPINYENTKLNNLGYVEEIIETNFHKLVLYKFTQPATATDSYIVAQDFILTSININSCALVGGNTNIEIRIPTNTYTLELDNSETTLSTNINIPNVKIKKDTTLTVISTTAGNVTNYITFIGYLID